MKKIVITILISLLVNCSFKKETINLQYTKNILNYKITPQNKQDKNGLIFSDQGAWFGYGLNSEISESFGFNGPFLMTQENGVWLATSFLNTTIFTDKKHPLAFRKVQSNSYSSHFKEELISEDKKIKITQQLTFKNGHTACINIKVKNVSNETINTNFNFDHSPIFVDDVSLNLKENCIQINSNKTNAKGYLTFPKNVKVQLIDDLQYQAKSSFNLLPNKIVDLTFFQTFIFPKYSWEEEKNSLSQLSFDSLLAKRIEEKEQDLSKLFLKINPKFNTKEYKEVLAKSYVTLQNNWRIPAGEIKREGLFPSYHYKWFNGFWAWDSWKHAVGVSFFNTKLAKEQIHLMFDFQEEDGFVPDCVFRDTLIEKHNYRDTKPPLSTWAVYKVFKQDNDIDFLKNMYPKLKKYHKWWYLKRDHDKDSLCEYGSTDGTVIAAKWESGMDNAIRFDNSKILKNGEKAYSLNQESVDLNAYLYLEKKYLEKLAIILEIKEDEIKYKQEAKKLRNKIINQFYDKQEGWFYDTTLKRR